ncbi:exodeoxyribonuclease VII large subunit [Parvularcula sp. ZS-1/3]|uniref:Exodeoxyribonuclease 7 large subunit n=1 Tax=Parvularcula mediterranea TaxID=2732508 RepID=A0A7Y3W4G4_9PROT|nr:exodeoxyribonuclease VII large subunit [Parvularcula mediterranea]NNU15216.1 exodeoxyribonuclease VII large subunit [Parvularcula mediterranea]
MSENVPEFSVSELSGQVKKTLEDSFGYVRVRGELGRVTRAGSGHVYLDLKDERAVLSSVMWKGTAQRQAVKPEQGMEVIAQGRLSTFPGQSRYQLIIDQLSPAGAGALMALYEERKKKLAAEGLFDPDRKRSIPSLPRRIGVVTSPSGAVIRDILHRLRDRFPSHVMVWPTLVQGESAPRGIVRGIKGFANLTEEMRPDVIIVARGGGSLEDLWCFNDEDVVRAAAASLIPLISAVGHETDTTLIDFASDLRAPTPTAAAELAVPVRSELLARVAQAEARLSRGVSSLVENARLSLGSAIRGLGTPDNLTRTAEQRLDRAETRLSALADRLTSSRELALSRAAPRFVPSLLLRPVEKMEAKLAQAKLPGGLLMARLDARADKVAQAGRLLGSVSYRGVLERGFALVTDCDGKLVKSKASAAKASALTLTFADGEHRVGAASMKKTPKQQKEGQGDLF